MSYKCLHCSRTFATPYALKRHISDKHQYNTNEDEEEAFQGTISVPSEEAGLWDEDILYEEPGLWEEDFTMNYSEVIRQLSCYSSNY